MSAAGVKTWTTRDRSSWGSGPWDGEPDKVSWTDTATGRPCLAVRGPVGAWCGYVAVDPGHPLHGRDYEVPNVDVHGGLTYADSCQERATEAEGVCHVPQPGQPHDVWWFGFDCAHLGDLWPAGLRCAGFGEAYRTLAYVQAQCADLARQLVAKCAS